MTDHDVIDDLVMARASAAVGLASRAGSQSEAAHCQPARENADLCELLPQRNSPRPLAGEGQGVRGRGSAKRPSPSQVPSAQRGRWWPALCLLLAALFAGRSLSSSPSVSPAPSQKAAVSHGHQPASQAIETIRVGQRVVTSVPGDAQAGTGTETQVDPATWRLLRLRAEDRWADGTLDVVEVETLQSPEWIAAHDAVVGAQVPLPLDLQEMGLSESLRAEVTANAPCPPIARGPGRVVLTTVNHLNPDGWELTLADERGRQERLRPTGSHKFYSLDRNEFIPAEDLREGERLQGVNGRLTLLHRERLPGVHRVYNMTVETEHVYHVALMGALVHNTCPGTSIASRWPGNNGFMAEPTSTTLQPGTLIDRYGASSGFFASPAGTPFVARSLPPEALARPLNAYRVVKPIEGVKSGLAAPYFGQPGLGLQYEFAKPI